jgi:shikimate kinase
MLGRCIVATGGGAVLDPENARVLKSLGWIVLLTAEEEALVRRMRTDPTSREQRPAFSGKDFTEPSEQDMLKETKEILTQRMPIYRHLADLVIDTTSASPAEMADEILRHFSCED